MNPQNCRSGLSPATGCAVLAPIVFVPTAPAVVTKSATNSVDSTRISCVKIPALALHSNGNSVLSVDSFRFAKKKKGKQKVLSLQKVNQRREVNYCGF